MASYVGDMISLQNIIEVFRVLNYIFSCEFTVYGYNVCLNNTNMEKTHTIIFSKAQVQEV